MNWDRIEGNWNQMTGAVKSQWGDLTDDEITEARGNLSLIHISEPTRPY